MKKFVIILLIVGISYSSNAQRKKDRLVDQSDSLSYAIGISVANSLKSQQIPDLKLEKIYQAINDVMGKKQTKMSNDESQKFIQTYMMNLSEKQKKDNLEKANKFLEENKKGDGVVVLPSGLQYEILRKGTGESPVSSSTVKTNYKGMLLDGTVFDSSYDRGKPIEFQVGRVIDGWQEALKLMKPGAKWKLYIHPDLGYGDRATGSIPANSLLIFEIELLSVE